MKMEIRPVGRDWNPRQSTFRPSGTQERVAQSGDLEPGCC